MAATHAEAVRSPGRRLLTVVAFLVTLAVVWTASLILHEVGHGLAAQALGGQIAWLRVWPGVEVWPSPGQPSEGPGGSAIARLGYTTGQDWGTDSWQDGVVGLMGSGANLLLAALALGGLWLFRPRGLSRTSYLFTWREVRGWPRLVLMAQALMFADLLLYCTLPEFWGLPHYLVFGGSHAEPLDSAELLGCPRWALILLALLASALMTWGLVAYVRRGRAGDRPTEG